MQKRNLAKTRAFQLAFVQRVRGKAGLAIDRNRAGGGQPDRIGDLEPLVRIAADKADPVAVGQDAIEIDKPLELVGGIVDRGARCIDVFNAQRIVAIIGRYEIVGLSGRAAIFQAGFDGVVAAAINRRFAAVGKPAFGVNVDHTSGAQAVLCGQRPGQQVEMIDQAR